MRGFSCGRDALATHLQTTTYISPDYSIESWMTTF